MPSGGPPWRTPARHATGSGGGAGRTVDREGRGRVVRAGVRAVEADVDALAGSEAAVPCGVLRRHGRARLRPVSAPALGDLLAVGEREAEGPGAQGRGPGVGDA